MNTLDQLVRDEGFRPTLYKDSKGFWTVAIGMCIDPAVPGAGLTLEEAEAVLQVRVSSITQALAAHLRWFHDLDVVRQAVIVNMTFNLGFPRLCGFHHFLSFMSEGNWAQASAEMLHSLWATEVGVRAQRLSQQILTGEWQ